MKKNSNLHIPVMLKESIDALKINNKGIYIDCTAGRGGHSAEILKRIKTGKLICIDQDLDAIEFLNKKFKNNKKVVVVRGNFCDIDDIMKRLNLKKADGFLLDLGVSSPMLDNLERGFSYHADATLDMRMDQTQRIDAKFLINNSTKSELINMFRKYGEINNPIFVVNKIVDARKINPINTTQELVNIIKSCVSFNDKSKNKHPAKQYFQALRICVNDELNALVRFLAKAPHLLNKNGRIIVITFHSLEDRIVKQEFNNLVTDNTPKEVLVSKNIKYKLFNKKIIIPTSDELSLNIRAHSAKLRGVIYHG